MLWFPSSLLDPVHLSRMQKQTQRREIEIISVEGSFPILHISVHSIFLHIPAEAFLWTKKKFDIMKKGTFSEVIRYLFEYSKAEDLLG